MVYGAFYSDLDSLFGYNKSFCQSLFLLPQFPHWRGIIFLKPQRFCTSLFLISLLPPLHHFLLPPNLCCDLSPFIAILISAPSRSGSKNIKPQCKVSNIFTQTGSKTHQQASLHTVSRFVSHWCSQADKRQPIELIPFLWIYSANVQFPHHAPGLSQEQTVKTNHEC